MSLNPLNFSSRQPSDLGKRLLLAVISNNADTCNSILLWTSRFRYSMEVLTVLELNISVVTTCPMTFLGTLFCAPDLDFQVGTDTPLHTFLLPTARISPPILKNFSGTTDQCTQKQDQHLSPWRKLRSLNTLPF